MRGVRSWVGVRMNVCGRVGGGVGGYNGLNFHHYHPRPRRRSQRTDSDKTVWQPSPRTPFAAHLEGSLPAVAQCAMWVSGISKQVMWYECGCKLVLMTV